jgi:A/G-specific adenine glycosylase
VDIGAYTQGLMDLGATLCTRTRPRCESCPFGADCTANVLSLQSDLPGKRPTKSLPERATGMLILRHGNEILLEKRPVPGIWGGLWSLPESAPNMDPVGAVIKLGYQPVELEEKLVLTHSFTHFRLHIQPWLITVQRPSLAEEPGRVWLSLNELDGAALPTPIRRILEAIR